MIYITSQDAYHQYDDNGNAITTWDTKKCAWIVEKEYENEKINWWGRDNDFPAGYTLSEYIQAFPNWNERPDITVKWISLIIISHSIYKDYKEKKKRYIKFK